MIRFALWSNLLMGGSAAGWVILTHTALQLPVDWLLVALAFVLAVGFYTRDRLDEEEWEADLRTMPGRTAWIRRHQVAFRRVIWLSFILAGLLLVRRPGALPPILGGLGFALTYTARWLPWRGRRLSWKQLPAMKMPYVALLWTVLTVLAPASAHARMWEVKPWLLALAVFLLVMVQILLNDFRDAAGDQLAGTHSLPVFVGIDTARRIGYALAALAAAIGLYLAPVALPLTALYSIILLRWYRLETDGRWRLWIEIQGLVPVLPALTLTAV